MTFCIKLKETRMRDGARFGDKVRSASKYNVKDMATNELIFDYLTELADSNGQNVKVVTSVGSDKSRTFTQVFSRSYKGTYTEFTNNRIDSLVNNVVALKKEYYDNILNNIINDYTKALDIQIENKFDINIAKAVISAELLKLYNSDEVGKNPKKLRKLLNKKFQDKGLDFTLDYHYVMGNSGPQLKDLLWNQFSKSEDQLKADVLSVVEQDLAQLKKLVPLGTHAGYLVKQLNPDAVTTDDEIRSEEKGDTDRMFEKQVTSSSGEAVSFPTIKKEYYDNVYKQFVLERMLATRMSNDAMMGSTYFYKGKDETTMFIEKNKREAAIMSTIVPFDTTNPYGISRVGKFVAVENPKKTLQSLTAIKDEKMYDGASYSTELHMIQMKNSLGDNMGQPSGTGGMKTIGVYHNEKNGTMTFKKHNDFTITHELIRMSKGNELDFGAIQDNLYKASDITNINLEGYFKKLPDNKLIVTYLKDGSKNSSVITYNKFNKTLIVNGNPVTITNMKELYDILGGAYSYDPINKRYTTMGEKGHSSTILSDMVAYSVLQGSDVRPNIINGFNFTESLKSSQPNINSLEDLQSSDISNFVTFTVDRSHEGIQLNASKETDDKEASLPTQVLGALGLAGATQDQAERAYHYLKELVIKDIEFQGVDGKDLDSIKKSLRGLTLNTLATSNVSSLASIILNRSNIIPFDNPQLVNIVTAALNSYLTSNGIRQKVFGSQFVLIPPVQVYDDGANVRYGDNLPREQFVEIPIKDEEGGYIDPTLRNLSERGIILDPEEEMAFLMDIKSEYQVTFTNFDNNKYTVVIPPGATVDEIKNNIKEALLNLTVSTGMADISIKDYTLKINSYKPRDLKPARSKIINTKTKTVMDVYSLEEGQQLRSGQYPEGYNRSNVLNLLNLKLNQIANDSEFVVVDYPGEVLAPKIWKSRFFLGDQTRYENINKEYYLSLLNADPLYSDIAKSIQDAYQRRLGQLSNRLEEVINESVYSKENFAEELVNSFNKATQVVTTRIPLQSLASVMANKIVGFIDTAENTVMINNEHQTLTGGDYDVDKTTLISYYVDDNGLVYDVPPYDKINPQDLSNYDKKAIINGLFDAIKSASINFKNFVQRESGVDMGDVQEASKKAKSISGKKELREDSAISRMIARYANMDGKVNIGPEAVSIKSFSAITSSTVLTFERIKELLKSGSEEDLKKAAQLAEYITNTFQNNIEVQGSLEPIQKLLDNKTITTSELIANILPNYALVLTEALSHSDNPKYEDYKNVDFRYQKTKSIQDILTKQPQVADMLGQLLNAATDNAKYLYLSDLNLNLTTTGMANAMIMMGMEIDQMAQLTTNPVFKSIIEDINTSIFEESEYKRLIDEIDNGISNYLKKYPDKDDTSQEVVFFKSVKDYYKKIIEYGEELTLLGQILGINQGLNPTSYGTYTRIYNVNVYMDGLNLIVDTKPFNFEKFITDSSYRELAVQEYDKVKKGTNILHILNEKPDVMEQLNIAVTSLKVQRASGKKLDTTIKLFEKLKQSGIIKGRIKEEQFTAVYNGVNNYTIDMFLQDKTIKLNGVTYDLGVLTTDKERNKSTGRLDFIEDMSDHLISLRNKNEIGTALLSRVETDTTKSDRLNQKLSDVAQVTFDPNPTGISHRDVIIELSMTKALSQLDAETLNALRIYNLILYKDTLKQGSFTKYFGSATETMYDYWDFEASDASIINVNDEEVQNYIIAQAIRYGFGKIEYEGSSFDPYDAYDSYFGEDEKEYPEIVATIDKKKATVTIARKDSANEKELLKTTVTISNPIEPLLPKNKEIIEKKELSVSKKQDNQKTKKLELDKVLESEKNKKAVLLGLLNMNILTSEC